jgi:pyruvate kinase
MRRHRKAKIVATLGPASSDEETIRRCSNPGRMYFALTSAMAHSRIIRRANIVRKVEQETGRPIAVLADLQGPKLRIGTFADGPIKLAAGASFG